MPGGGVVKGGLWTLGAGGPVWGGAGFAVGGLEGDDVGCAARCDRRPVVAQARAEVNWDVGIAAHEAGGDVTAATGGACIWDKLRPLCAIGSGTARHQCDGG